MRAAIGLLLLAGACATPPGEPAPVEPAGSAPAPFATEAAIPARPTLEDLLQFVDGTPRLAAARAAVERAEGEREQAALAPNPELVASAERVEINEVGDGPEKYTVGVRQRIETAGKRDERERVARLRGRSAEASTVEERIQLAGQVATAHQQALVHAAVAALLDESLEALQALLALEERRVAAGRRKESVLAPLRALEGRLRLERAERAGRARAALRQLEGVLAQPSLSIQGAAGDLLDDADLPAANGTGAVAANPELARLEADRQAARAAVALAEAGGTPDLTVGLRYEDEEFPGGGDRRRSFGLFFEWPLPVRNRNQGAIRAAQAEARRLDLRLAEVEGRLRGRYGEILDLLEALTQGLAVQRDTVLAARASDLAYAEAEFANGRSDRLRVLEARLAWLEARRDTLELEGRRAELLVEALALLGRDPATWR